MPGDPMTSSKEKVVGVYGGDVVPGTYVKTRTGTVRGEELFCRPDMERPWRSTSVQKRTMDVAKKEKEIEEWMRLCSNLRTELGNAKSDARFLEYAVTEKAKAEKAQLSDTIAELEAKVALLTKENSEMKESTEHQIRLLKSQHESEAAALKSEARTSTERCAELAKTYQRQVDDVKAASIREVEFIESRSNGRLEELKAELRSVRESAKASEEHFNEQMTSLKIHLDRVEAEYKERLRSSENRMDGLHRTHEEAIARVNGEKEAAVAEARATAGKLAVSLIDRDEVVQRFIQWNQYVVAGLDAFYKQFVTTLPELAVEPVDPQLHQVPTLYGPRAVLEEPEAKLTMERITYRLLQLKSIKTFSTGEKHTVTEPATMERVEKLHDKQDRLSKALRETEERCAETEIALNGVLGRLYFFSDNLEDAVRHAAHSRPPPLRNVIFACLSVPKGDLLWSVDPDNMRTAMTLLHNTLRLKMAEYGAYECYSDSVSVLLAFDDPVGACRFCTELQVWLLNVPWPAALLSRPLACEETTSDHKVIFRGLRVAVAMHTGEAFVEPSAIPSSGTYRCHYYGRAVSQIVHISSLAQGGQVLISKPAWALCLQRRHELGRLVLCDLGTFPILSFNSETGVQERQSIELLQVTSTTLRDRSFRPTSKLDTASVTSLSGVKAAILGTEIEAVTARREALGEAVSIVRTEFIAMRKELDALSSRVRQTKSQFHLLPPTEMVTQMNDLYNIMERIASHADEMGEDIDHLMQTQEGQEQQVHALREYFGEQHCVSSKEDELRTEIEVSAHRMDQTMRELSLKHREEVDRLQRALLEREQAIRTLYQQSVDAGFASFNPSQHATSSAMSLPTRNTAPHN